MHLRRLKLENLKRIQSLDLRFVRADDQVRPWTVIIGENGTAKTTILQAIALAAAGTRQVNTLGGSVTPFLLNRRVKKPADMRIDATFGFSDIALSTPDVLPGLVVPYPRGLRLRSEVGLPAGASQLEARSWYEADEDLPAPASKIDPLDRARDRHQSLWFVAGYGVERHLPKASARPELSFPETDRLRPLFEPDVGLTSMAFANYFGDESEDGEQGAKAQAFNRVLRKALFTVRELMQALVDVEVRGHGGVKAPGDLQERTRFVQQMGGQKVNIPTTALSHGYQSTIAWIADLVGHIILESSLELSPEAMRGLVLIDEIDLYLHPKWQIVLVRALRQTFSGMQFVVTTHSPLVLAALDPDMDQIIRLEEDATTGDIIEDPVNEDPRLLTGTELLRLYYGLDDIHPGEVGRLLREYRYLAANPYRTPADEGRMREYRAELDKQHVDPHFEPVTPRSPNRRPE